MRILITGGTSSVASALIDRISNEHEIITAGRKNCDVTLDLSEKKENIALPENLDVIIHTAAAFGGKSYREIHETEFINVIGTLNLCAAAHECGAKHFVLISSIFALLPESSPFYSSYAMSKKHSEEIAALFCKLNELPLTILRPSQLYGDTDTFRKHQPLIYAMADKAQQNENILINGNNDPKRNFLHVSDLAQIIFHVIKQKITGTFSCAQTEDISFSQIGQSAIEAFQSTSTINFDISKPDIPDNIFTPENSIYDKINYRPEITITEGMKRIAQNRLKQT